MYIYEIQSYIRGSILPNHLIVILKNPYKIYAKEIRKRKNDLDSLKETFHYKVSMLNEKIDLLNNKIELSKMGGDIVN